MAPPPTGSFPSRSAWNSEERQDRPAVITTVTIPAGDQYTQPFFYMKAKAAGTGSVTISAPNYTPLTQSVTVAP
jgi:hypothetical protein